MQQEALFNIIIIQRYECKEDCPTIKSTMADTDIMGDLVNAIHPALHRVQDWPYPDQIDHALYRA